MINLRCKQNRIGNALVAAAVTSLIVAAPINAQNTSQYNPTSDPSMQQPMRSSGTSASTLNTTDRNSLLELARANLSEISLAKLAQTKSKDDKVLSFAQRMLDDHTKLQDQLAQLAQEKNVQFPKSTDAAHQKVERRLSALSGEQFDRQYMERAGVVEQRNTHRIVMRIDRHAQDKDLKTLAQNLLPEVDQHMQMARQMHMEKYGRKSPEDISSGK
jgi:putative membrane protein